MRLVVLVEVLGAVVVLSETVVPGVTVDPAPPVPELPGDVVDVARSNNPQPLNTRAARSATAATARVPRIVFTPRHPRIPSA
jgi:hypothetical protein